MKNCIYIIVLLALSGCTSPYMEHRGRDAADVFTLTAGGVGGGIKARVGPLNLGLPYYSLEGAEAGLRGGQLVSRHSASVSESWFLTLGWEKFVLEDDPRCKSIRSSVVGRPELAQKDHNAAKWTQIDLTFGMNATVRFGINPGELLDFILGWTTLDIYKDDI